MLNPYSTQSIDDADIQSVVSALKSPLLTQGPLTQEFEEMLADFCHAKYALTFNSATSALYTAYKACNLENSEAITSPISFVATSNMLIKNACKPIFCDIQKDGNIDPLKIQSLITPQTRAIVSIDYAGKSVDIHSILLLAKKYGLKFISDSSHALGSQYQKQNIGSFADVSIFSFHPVKPITTLEGGALVTNDEEIYEKAKQIRVNGVIKSHLWHYDVVENGFNFRMNEVQAALGISQLKKLSHFIKIREEIASFYDSFFKGNPYFETLHQYHTDISSNHLYPILIYPDFWSKKEKIFTLLLELQIGVQVHYRPIYDFSYYKNQGYQLHLSNTEKFYQSTLSIPCHHKMTFQDAQECAKKILSVFENL